MCNEVGYSIVVQIHNKRINSQSPHATSTVSPAAIRAPTREQYADNPPNRTGGPIILEVGGGKRWAFTYNN